MALLRKMTCNLRHPLGLWHAEARHRLHTLYHMSYVAHAYFIHIFHTHVCIEIRIHMTIYCTLHIYTSMFHTYISYACFVEIRMYIRMCGTFHIYIFKFHTYISYACFIEIRMYIRICGTVHIRISKFHTYISHACFIQMHIYLYCIFRTCIS